MAVTNVRAGITRAATTRAGMMQTVRTRLVNSLTAICFVAVSMAGCVSWAQDEDSQTVSPNEPILTEGTSPLDATMLFQDETGKLLTIPNISMEEVLRLLERDANVFAAYQFTSVTAQVIVSGDRADVIATFGVSLPAGSQGAEIPLSFGSCQVGSELPDVRSSDDEHFQSQFFADSSGYRLIIVPGTDENATVGDKPPQATNYTIQLKGKTRIQDDTDRKSLRIDLPFFTSEIQVSLPASSLDPQVSGNAFSEITNAEDRVLVSISTRGGEIAVNWRERETLVKASELEAQTATIFSIAGPTDAWLASTSLSLRWFGNGATESFRIRLPPGARWRQLPRDDFERYTVSPVSSDNDDPSQPRSVDLVITNVDPARYSNIELRDLEWEWLPEFKTNEQGAEYVQALALELDGVTSHRGTIDVLCPALFRLIYHTGEGAKLLQQAIVSDTYTSQQMQFAFDRQPFDLRLRFEEEKTLPTVRPTYHVAVDENKLVLTGWLDCSFDANSVTRSLTLLLDDWVPQDNTARALADPKNWASNDGELLRVEAKREGYEIASAEPDGIAFGTSRKVQQVWRFVAERPWLPDENELRFSIPEIVRGPGDRANSGAGVLIVSAQDRIVLNWEETLSRELLEDSLTEAYRSFLPKQTTRKPLVYRFQNEGGVPVWAGGVSLLPQEVVSSEAVSVGFASEQVSVEQDFSLEIANVPLNRIEFAVPDQYRRQSLQFRINEALTTGQPVQKVTETELAALVGRVDSERSSPTKSDGSAGGAGESDSPPATKVNPVANETERSESTWTIYRLIGAPSLDKNASVRVNAVISDSNLSLGSSDAPDGAPTDQVGAVEMRVPLAQLILEKPPRIHNRTVELEGTEFVVSTSELSPSNGPLGWQPLGADAVQSVAPESLALRFRVQSRREAEVADITVGRSWLQTAITATERQDRFVAEFRCSASSIRLVLPALASIKPAPRIYMDDQLQLAPYDPVRESFDIPVGVSENGEHKLEVIYEVAHDLDDWSRFEVSPPAIVGAEANGRFYWQLATPRTYHLVRVPEALTADWKWSWNGVWWYRQSTLSEATLVSMLSASEERLPASTNRYLMSGGFPDSDLPVLVVARYVIWFPVGCLAIALAALVINVEFFRRPLAIAFLAIPCAIATMIYPDLGALLGQSVAMSLGLVLLVWATHLAIESRVRRRSVFSSRTVHDGTGQLSGIRSSRISDIHVSRGSSVAANTGGE